MSETMTQRLSLIRIAEIDRYFEDAGGWGSWMVGCANERERLVNSLKAEGITISHKWLARAADGGPTS